MTNLQRKRQNASEFSGWMRAPCVTLTVKTAGLLQQAAEADFRILDELEEIRRPESRWLIQLLLDGTTTAEAREARHA
jgi:hypothetical protein